MSFKHFVLQLVLFAFKHILTFRVSYIRNNDYLKKMSRFDKIYIIISNIQISS